MGIRLFAGISHAQMKNVVLRMGASIRLFSKSEVIVHEGIEAKWLFAVLSGCLNVYESGESGERHLIWTVESGHLFGATLVNMHFDFYPGMAVAAVNSEVVLFDLAKIRELRHDTSYKKFFENLDATVSERVFFCWRKLAVLSCKTTEEKFMAYLRWYVAEKGSNDVTLPFARMEDCATFLGVTRASLSPAIGHLKARGVIQHVGRTRFRLLGR